MCTSVPLLVYFSSNLLQLPMLQSVFPFHVQYQLHVRLLLKEHQLFIS